MLRNTHLQETNLLEGAVQQLAQLLPPTWDLQLELELGSGSLDDYSDGHLTVRPPRGHGTRFKLVAKLSSQSSARAMVSRLAHQLDRAAPEPTVVVTDFANPALRRGCQETGLGYLDLTGWALLHSDDGIYLANQGAPRSPTPPAPRNSAITRLDGPGASGIIRALWDAELPVGVRELANRAGVSPGTVAKLLPTLASYGAIERSDGGAVAAVDRRLLIARWTEDYGIFTTNPEVLWLIDPRGPDHAHRILTTMRGINEPHSTTVALTGVLAALAKVQPGQDLFYPVIPHSVLAIYSSDPRRLAKLLGLKEAKASHANVVIVRPRDESLLRDDLVTVPLPQVLADLMTMGSRFPELADQILDVVSPVDTQS